MGVHLRLLALWPLLSGCEGNDPKDQDSPPPETGEEPDADTDADSDTDTDTDTDTDMTPVSCIDEDLGSVETLELSGSTVGQGDDHASSCGGAGSPDRAYLFTAPEDGDYVFDTVGSAFDALLAIDDQCGGSELVCDDDSAGGLQAHARVTLVEGQQVVIWVDGYYGEGEFALRVRHPPPVDSSCTDDLDEDLDLLLDCLDPDCEGDGACALACPYQTLGEVPGRVTGSTLGEPDSFQGYCSPGFQPTSDLSFAFTAPSDGRYVFALDPAETDFDSVLSLWDTCGGYEFYCKDEEGPGGERLILDLLEGETLVLVVDGWHGSAGNFALEVLSIPSTESACEDGQDEDQDGLTDCEDPDCDIPAICPETCDNLQDEDGDGRIDCADGSCAEEAHCQVGCPEETLTGPLPIVVEGSTLGLGDEWQASCTYESASDQTWSFVAPEAGTYTFTTQNSSYDPMLFVLDGCGGAELACNDDYDYYYGDTESMVEVTLEEGQEVIIVVDGYGGQSGSYTLTVQ